MDIGRLRYRIELWDPVDGGEDDIGGNITTTPPTTEVWANVIVETGDRDERDRTVETTNTYRIIIRSGSYPVNLNTLILWKGIEMTVHHVTENYFDSYKEIEAWG